MEKLQKLLIRSDQMGFYLTLGEAADDLSSSWKQGASSSTSISFWQFVTVKNLNVASSITLELVFGWLGGEKGGGEINLKLIFIFIIY